MKSIAEYFRDLAADDRYFGAEPPTPDAEMLSRIAEREITRRVEARTEASGIVLRPAAADAVMRGEQARLSNEQAATPDAGSTAETVTETAPKPGPTITRADQEETSVKVSGKVSGKVSETAPEGVETADITPIHGSDPIAPVSAVISAPDWSADEFAEDVSGTPQNTETGQEMTDSDVGTAPGSDAKAEVTPSALLAASDPEVQIQEPAAAAPAAPVHTDADSVAAKLQRIRAVVGRNEAQTGDIFTEDLSEPETVAQDTSAEDETAPETVDTIEEEIVEAASDTVDEAVEDAPEAAQDDTSDQDAVLANVLAQDAAENTAPVEDASDEPSSARVQARVVRMKKSDTDDTAEPNSSAAIASVLAGLTPVDATEEDNAPEDDMSEFEGLAALDGAEEFDDLIASDDKASLSAEEEAALMEELAEVERELAPEVAEYVAEDVVEDVSEAADIEDAAEDASADVSAAIANVVAQDVSAEGDQSDAIEVAQTEETPEQSAVAEDQSADDAAEVEAVDDEAVEESPRRNILTDSPLNDEASVSRILSEADAQMKEPEGNRRRQAIAHLKAAVAATEAARQLGEKADDNGEATNAFRDDLDQVVRPRRARRLQARTERPRPAPLKLVASQRVDVPAEAPSKPVEPVRPRRVQSTTEQDTSSKESNGFAEFANSVGAHSLQDMLEAAAAYLSDVEGAENFSRPQLLRKVRNAMEAEHSREDELRSFGVLLRQGRIEKVRNGRFQISDQIRFRQEPRAAQG
ncbi:hypothetical protein [Aestuariibius sp. HNIBRBA575]|uniref:hypothetical protein n=1 Tax=Aestuariibius sp. HNIBRBA575 TaxID=3233343 RepID=UPI0034A1C4F0